MKEYILTGDTYKLNWVEGNTEWGTVKCSLPLAVETESIREGDVVKESYTFRNHTDRDIFTGLRDIGIYTPFNDDYTTGRECMTGKCHAHIWCGGETAYIMGLRMGGEPPHAGMVLTDGSIGGYSIERDENRRSNDRGDIILHPTPFSLAPGEHYTVSWTVFAHGGKEDFFEKAKLYCGRFLEVGADQYVLFAGEKAHIRVKPAFGFGQGDVRIGRDGDEMPFTVSEGVIALEVPWEEGLCRCGNSAKREGTGGFSPDKEGGVHGPVEGAHTIRLDICVGGVRTHIRLLALPGLDALVRARCRFIAKKQQYHRKGSHLDGAYLVYDREEDALFYSPQNDFNGGRERVGMGVVLARYLQEYQDLYVEQSLRDYTAYVERELVDRQTGEVYNDYMRDNSYHRLYNAPWFSLFYLELYRLWKKPDFLAVAYRILMYYYKDGGGRFYPILLPAAELLEELQKQGMAQEAGALRAGFLKHADLIAMRGTDYPQSEVNYEQSIVAPAADILLQAYEVTGEERYLDGAARQLKVLELFNGIQPDYHLNEVAIRHWDGYWFGKGRMYGDTFPHYWSSLTGKLYMAYYRILGDEKYRGRAEKSLRASLSLFGADGTASCAYLYPVAVNGRKGDYADAYANDQDWGIYFAMRYL